ncbi:MAG TPA: hypothetical protein VKQ72_02670 [Aggregatilineales bacterium]|nr:hypothetical protein [Aggregatilineales bacterium]
MTVGTNLPIWGVLGGIAGPLLRLLQEKLTPPQKGLKYYDLDITPAADLAHLIVEDGDNAGAVAHRKPYTHFIRLTNYGREVIDANDYIRPFRVQYQDGANTSQIAGYRIIRDDRTVHPKIYGSTAAPASIVFHDTLNPGDTIVLGVLLALGSEPERAHIDGRIKGIPRLNLKWHHHSATGSRMIWRLVIHYFALPLALMAGLLVGYVITLVINPYADAVRSAINYLLEQFGLGLVIGLILGGILAAVFEIWEYFSFRSQRRTVENAFRNVVRERLDKPLPLE